MTQAESESKSRDRIFGILTAAAGFLMVFTTLGFTSTPRSLYLTAVTEDLGVPRSLFSLNDSIRFVTTAAFNMFFGALVARFGARKLIAGGFAAMISAMLIYSFSVSIFTFYIGSFLLGIGFAWTTTTIIGFLVENWFTENKGLIMGCILASNGLGGAIAAQMISRFLNTQGRIAGWRLSYFVTSVILAAVGLIILVIVRDRPQERGLHPVTLVTRGEKKAKNTEQAWEGIPFEDVRKKPYFYISLICVFITGMVLQSISGVSSAHMKDSGIDPAVIANVVSFSSLMLMVSKTSIGFVFDKVGLRITLLLCNTCSVIAIVRLALVSSPAAAYTYSFFNACAQPLETIMLPLIAKDFFGNHSYAKIMGIYVAVNTLGYAFGGPTMNLFYDTHGTYRPIMLALGVVMIIATMVMQTMISIAHRDRNTCD